MMFILLIRNSVAKKYRREFRGTLSDGDREGIVKAYRKVSNLGSVPVLNFA